MGSSGSLIVYSAEFVSIIVLLVCSALISGSEVAFFSISPKQLMACKSSEYAAERNIAALLVNPRKLLATVLILNNLVNVSIVTISTHILVGLIGQDSQDAALAFSILTLVVTFLIVFFGEVVPKVYSNQRSMSFARFTATGMLFMSRVCSPLSWALLQMSKVVERRIEKKGYKASVDELNEALNLTATSETTDEEKGILRGIVNFGTITVKQIMQSRLDITSIDIDTDYHSLLRQINEMAYSRLPVFNGTIDKIEGILYIKDLLPHLGQPKDFEWQSLIRREIYFVPENKKIDQLMKDFQARRVHMAIVVDEYGGTSGLITLEDVIEEVIGDINDEFDSSDVVFKKIDESTYSFEGKTSLNDFCKIIEVDPNVFGEIKGDSESLGGLMLELFGRLPRVGNSKRFKNFLFTVTLMEKKRVKSVRVKLLNEGEQASETPTADA